MWVARGSIEYSAVTQPLPVFFKKDGTLSSMLAVHSTLVLPASIRADPSACSETPGIILQLPQCIALSISVSDKLLHAADSSIM